MFVRYIFAMVIPFIHSMFPAKNRAKGGSSPRRSVYNRKRINSFQNIQRIHYGERRRSAPHIPKSETQRQIGMDFRLSKCGSERLDGRHRLGGLRVARIIIPGIHYVRRASFYGVWFGAFSWIPSCTARNGQSVSLSRLFPQSSAMRA